MASNNQADVTLAVRADLDQAKRGLAELRDQINQLGPAGKRGQRDLESFSGSIAAGFRDAGRQVLGVAAALLSVQAATAGFRQIVAVTIDAEAQANKLESTLRATGGAAGYSAGQIAEMAAGLQRLTTFEDDAITGAAGLLASFTNIRGDVFAKSLGTVLDVAQALKIDLPAAAEAIGRALDQPANASRALRGLNIILTDSQDALIKGLIESGKGVEAQGALLDILAGKYGGAAAAARDTFGGALGSLKIAFGDLLEAHGGLPEARAEIEKLTQFLQDPATAARADHFMSTLISGFSRLLGSLPAVLEKIESIIAALERAQPLLRALAGAVGGAAGAATGAAIGSFLGPVGATLGAVAGFGIGMAPALLATPAAPRSATTSPGTSSSVFLPGQSGRPAAPMPKQEFNAPKGGGGGGGGGKSAAQIQAEQIQAVIDKLRDEAATYGQTSAQQEIYKLQKMGANEATIAQAQALVDQISGLDEEKKAREAAIKAEELQAETKRKNHEADAALLQSMQDELELMRFTGPAREAETAARRLSADATLAQRDAARELARQQSARQEGAALTESLRTKQEQYDDELARYFDLLNRGEISTATFERAVESATQKLGDNAEQMSEFAIQAARNIQTAFADFLFDPFARGLSGMLRGFIDIIRRMIAEALAAQLGKYLFGTFGATPQGGGAATTGLIGGLLSGLTFHTGGVVGVDDVPMRAMPAIAYSNAPRYHGGGIAGLAPDEVPAVLRRGEEVLTANDPRHRANGMGAAPVVNLRNINLFDTQVVGDYLQSATGERTVLNIVRRNRDLLS